MLGTPIALMIVGRPVSSTHSVSGLVMVLGVMKRACTLIKAVRLALPNSMPLNVVFSAETGKLENGPELGKGFSVVVLTTTPRVYVSLPRE